MPSSTAEMQTAGGVNFSEAGDERFRTGLAGTGVFDEVEDFGNGGLAEFALWCGFSEHRLN